MDAKRTDEGHVAGSSPSGKKQGHDRSAVPRGLDSLVKLMMRSIKLEKVKPIV